MIQKAGVPHSIQYSDPKGTTGLFIQVKIKEVSNPASPVVVGSFPMVDVGDGQYVYNFTPLLGKTYVAKMVPYTDGTYSVIDTATGQGSDQFEGISLPNANQYKDIRALIDSDEDDDAFFRLWHGDSKVLAIIFEQDPGVGRLDLTGYLDVKVRFPLKNGQSSTYKEYTLSSGVAIDPDSPKLGRVLVTIPGTDTVNFNVGEAQDIEVALIDPSNLQETVKMPKVLYVYQSITEPPA